MIETLRYYLDLFISLCGFDGSNGNALVGGIVIAISTAVVIYAFYEGITKALWPGEQDTSHIKYDILDDSDSEREGAHRAH